MNPELNIYRILGAITAVLAAINTYFIALPSGTISDRLGRCDCSLRSPEHLLGRPDAAGAVRGTQGP
jgi:hypothetical protein